MSHYVCAHNQSFGRIAIAPNYWTTSELSNLFSFWICLFHCITLVDLILLYRSSWSGCRKPHCSTSAKIKGLGHLTWLSSKKVCLQRPLFPALKCFPCFFFSCSVWFLLLFLEYLLPVAIRTLFTKIIECFGCWKYILFRVFRISVFPLLVTKVFYHNDIKGEVNFNVNFEFWISLVKHMSTK